MSGPPRYRKRTGGLKKSHVKPRKSQTSGNGKSVLIMAAVIRGKIRVWHELDHWGGDAAADAYKGPLKDALKRAYPNHRTHIVLEDNDPSGYKSGKGMQAKQAARIKTLDLPKRSPDLNVLDYSLWSQINQQMRATERARPKDFKETRDEYKARLRRTAMGLPSAVVRKAVHDMARRVQLLKEAQGHYLEE